MRSVAVLKNSRRSTRKFSGSHLEGSVVAEHFINQRHPIFFEDTMPLLTLPQYTSRASREATGIGLHRTFKKEWNYNLSFACKNVNMQRICDIHAHSRTSAQDGETPATAP
jgi:hypothetical protein